MIFSAPRFIVIDDKEQHLSAIREAFQKLGTYCVGVRYNPAEELDSNHFRGVRCLFLDLHLIDGQAGTDQRRHFALIASILESIISKSGGPFVLVLWTEHAHYGDELRAYLDENIHAEMPHARPLAVLSLAKDKFINVGTGAANAPEELKTAVEKAVLSNPQLAALLEWEADVLKSAGDTLVSLLNLVPPENRKSKEFSSALDTVLSRLAREVAGPQHVEVDPRAAIANAFAPILTDRVLNQDVSQQSRDLWKTAVTRSADDKLGTASEKEAGHINRMLHFAMPGTETVRPTDWGAVVAWPNDWNDDELSSRVGVTVGALLGGQFLVEKNDRSKCTPVLVRIGAACDYAQNRLGPLTYLLGVEIPESAMRKKDSKGNILKLSDAVWRSPVYFATDAEIAVRLHVHFRFPMTVLQADGAKWTVRYRLREQLMMNLITATSGYVSRPGIVQLVTS